MWCGGLIVTCYETTEQLCISLASFTMLWCTFSWPQVHQSLAWLLFDLLSYCLILMKQLVSDLFGLYALLPFVCWLGKWLSFVFYWRFCEFVFGWSWKKHFRFVLQSKPKPKGSFPSSIELQIFYSNQHAHHFTCSSPDFATITKPSRRYNHPTKHLSLIEVSRDRMLLVHSATVHTRLESSASIRKLCCVV